MLESGKILKRKWNKTTKKWHVKTYIHKRHFQALKNYAPKIFNFTIHFGFQIIQFTIQEMVFRPRAGGESHEGKQLKFAPQLNKFAYLKLAFRNLMFCKPKVSVELTTDIK